jgi:hypothetical protein
MTLERRSVTYKDQEYSRYITKSIDYLSDIITLAGAVGIGQYFFGAVVQTDSELTTYFGNGPNHDAFEQLVRETSGSSGEVWTCHIGVNNKTFQVDGINFHQDPALTSTGGNIKQRLEVMKKLATAIPVECYYRSKIRIDPTFNLQSSEFYIYLPEYQLIQKIPSINTKTD